MFMKSCCFLSSDNMFGDFKQIIIYFENILRHFSLTHWGRGKIATISQTTFSNAFSGMKLYEFRLRFHWRLIVPEVRMNDILSLIQILAWRRPGEKPLSETMMVKLLMHICVTRPQWVKYGWNVFRWSDNTSDDFEQNTRSLYISLR